MIVRDVKAVELVRDAASEVVVGATRRAAVAATEVGTVMRGKWQLLLAGVRVSVSVVSALVVGDWVTMQRGGSCPDHDVIT